MRGRRFACGLRSGCPPQGSKRAVVYPLWRFRIAAKGRFGYHRQVWKVWAAWQRAEGGSARFNAWNTTEPWPGATDYNSAHVKNYPNAYAGTAATVATLYNGNYPRMVHCFRYPGRLSAQAIVGQCAVEFDRWGTGAQRILALL